MKITVTTVYSNCSKDFVDDYVKDLCINSDLFRCNNMTKDFMSGKKVGFISHGPDGEHGETTYLLEDKAAKGCE